MTPGESALDDLGKAKRYIELEMERLERERKAGG